MSSNIVQIRNQIVNHYKQKKEENNKKYIKKHNDYWNRYYQDHRWKELRNWYYNLHPCCEICEAQGIVTPADHVHHCKKFSSGLTEEAKYNLLLNPNNLMSVCRHDHKIIHKIMDEECKDIVTIKEVIDYKDKYDLNN